MTLLCWVKIITNCPIYAEVLNFSTSKFSPDMDKINGSQKNSVAKKILPFVAALTIFMIFSALYFSPLLQGKILLQSDIMNFIGVSKEATDHYNQTGDAALWTNSMFGGMPTYQVMLPENGNAFEQVNKYLGMFLPRPANYMFIALVTFFLLLRSFKINYFLSISGALCYALGTYLITFIEAGHNTKVNALAIMPLVLTGINYLVNKKYWLGSAVTLFAMTCQITANHPQITYYMFLIILCWMVSELIYAYKGKALKHFFTVAGIIIVTILFSVSANTSKLWTTYEYSKETIRGGSNLTHQTDKQDDGLNYDYAFAWSSGLAESFSIMYSNFAGGGSGKSFLQTKEGEAIEGPLMSYLQSLNQQSPQKTQELLKYSGQAGKYWGDMPFTSGPIYVGAILCFLFILGLIVGDNKIRWWILAATLISLFLGWGKNFPVFNNFMFDHFPIYNKFRTVSMAMTMLCLTIPVLGYYIVDRYLNNSGELDETRKIFGLKWAGITVAGLSLILLMSGSIFDLLSPNEEAYLAQVKDPQSMAYFELIKNERVAMIRSDVFVSTFLIGLAALMIFLFMRKTISKNIAIAAICILPVVDLLIVDSHYIGKDNFVEADFYDKRFRQSTPVIKDNDPHFRVLNTTTDLDKDGSTSYLYKSLGGYHGAKLQRYQDVIDGYLSKGNVQVISMLNAKYVTGSRSGKLSVDRNPMALGNAWFVDSIIIAADNDAEYEALGNFNPKATVIVHQEFKQQLPALVAAPDSTRSIKLKKYGLDEISYTSNSQTDAPAIFSEIWYRGNQDWKAYIDGKYVDHFRANYLLRGLWIPKGEHEIVFKFEPNSFYTGKKISTAASSLILILVAIGFFFAYKSNNKTTVTDNKV